MEEFPKRKSPRINGFPYNAAGCYFITICTKKRERLFSEIVGRGLDPAVEAKTVLKPFGRIAAEELLKIPAHFENLRIEKYAIMPDHIHFLLTIEMGEAGSRPRPTVSEIIGLYKSGVSRLCGRPVWQTSFHDHVIRGPQDYTEIWQYIDNNPLK